MAEECCASSDAGCAPQPVKFPERAAGHAAPLVTRAAVEDSCCARGVPVFDGVDPRYKVMLWTVIAINAAMFLTEMIAGQLRARRPSRRTRSIFSPTPSPMA